MRSCGILSHACGLSRTILFAFYPTRRHLSFSLSLSLTINPTMVFFLLPSFLACNTFSFLDCCFPLLLFSPVLLHSHFIFLFMAQRFMTCQKIQGKRFVLAWILVFLCILVRTGICAFSYKGEQSAHSVTNSRQSKLKMKLLQSAPRSVPLSLSLLPYYRQYSILASTT